jgi:hypothetical protein
LTIVLSVLLPLTIVLSPSSFDHFILSVLQTIQWSKEEGHTTQWPKEEGDNTMVKRRRRQYNGQRKKDRQYNGQKKDQGNEQKQVAVHQI